MLSGVYTILLECYMISVFEVGSRQSGCESRRIFGVVFQYKMVFFKSAK